MSTARKKDESFQEYGDRCKADNIQRKQANRGIIIWVSSKQGTYTTKNGPIGAVYLTGSQKRAAKKGKQ